MLVCVQSVGTVPVSYDCWNITLNIGAISLATNLSWITTEIKRLNKKKKNGHSWRRYLKLNQLVPVSYDCWNITLYTGAISLATILWILVGSKFCPLAFDGLKSESNFAIPLEVNSKSNMGVSGLPSMFGKFPVGRN
jgi:hypothetical protein